MPKRDLVFDTIDDLVSNFLYYDRKEDEELNVEEINLIFQSGAVTIEEAVDYFRQALTKGLDL